MIKNCLNSAFCVKLYKMNSIYPLICCTVSENSLYLQRVFHGIRFKVNNEDWLSRDNLSFLYTSRKKRAYLSSQTTLHTTKRKYLHFIKSPIS